MSSPLPTWSVLFAPTRLFLLPTVPETPAGLNMATSGENLVRAVNFAVRKLDDPIHFLIAEREQLREFPFAVFLVESLIDFGDLGGVHRTELRSAHRAEFCFFVKIIRQGFIVHGPGGFRIE